MMRFRTRSVPVLMPRARLGCLGSVRIDMRPYALMEDIPESVRIDEVSRGRLHRAATNHFVHKSFDILAIFKDVLGKVVAEIP
jgi:hypothetical protein